MEYANMRCDNFVYGSTAWAAEVVDDDGGGECHVEAFNLRRLVGGVGWYQKPVADEGSHVVRQSGAFVAHDDYAVWRECGVVDIMAVEQGAVHGNAVGQVVQKFDQVAAGYLYAAECAHSGLDYLGREGIDGVGGAHDVAYAVPHGRTDDGAEVARVLHAVEGQRQVGQQLSLGRWFVGGHFKYPHASLRRLLGREAFHVFRRDGGGFRLHGGGEQRQAFLGGRYLPAGELLKEFAYHLWAFGHKEPRGLALARVLEGSDFFDFVFRNHGISR